jgi:hypothetical protein
MRFLGVLACLLALLLTGYSAMVYKAPKVQADIQVRVEQALAGMAGEPIEVTVDGREVTLRGTVSDDGERARLLLAAGSVWGGLGPVAGLAHPPWRSLLLTLSAIVLTGLISGAIAVRRSMDQDLLPSLRQE